VKLSDAVKEMAIRLMKQPEAAHSGAAIDVAVLLASAAWNEALGDPGLRQGCRTIREGRPHASVNR